MTKINVVTNPAYSFAAVDLWMILSDRTSQPPVYLFLEGKNNESQMQMFGLNNLELFGDRQTLIELSSFDHLKDAETFVNDLIAANQNVIWPPLVLRSQHDRSAFLSWGFSNSVVPGIWMTTIVNTNAFISQTTCPQYFANNYWVDSTL